MKYRLEALKRAGNVVRFECDPGHSFTMLVHMLETHPEIEYFTVFENKKPYTGDYGVVYVCHKYVSGKVWNRLVENSLLTEFNFRAIMKKGRNERLNK